MTRNKAAWRAATIDERAWTKAKRMTGAQVAVCGYAPAGWPPGTTCIIRRVRAGGVSTDPRARRRRTIPKLVWLDENLSTRATWIGGGMAFGKHR